MTWSDPVLPAVVIAGVLAFIWLRDWLAERPARKTRGLRKVRPGIYAEDPEGGEKKRH